MRSFVAYVEYDPLVQLYVGTVPGVPGAHTQGATLDELRQNLKEVLELCLDDAAAALPSPRVTHAPAPPPHLALLPRPRDAGPFGPEGGSSRRSMLDRASRTKAASASARRASSSE